LPGEKSNGNPVREGPGQDVSKSINPEKTTKQREDENIWGGEGSRVKDAKLGEERNSGKDNCQGGARGGERIVRPKRVGRNWERTK